MKKAKKTAKKANNAPGYPYTKKQVVEAFKILGAALTACNRISVFAKRRGSSETWCVSSGDVEACDKAVAAAHENETARSMTGVWG